MDAKKIFTLSRRQAHRIVQILCVLAVYGDHLHIPQVLSARHIALAHRLCNTDRLIQHLLRKFHGNLKAFYNRKNVHPRVVYMPENLRYLSFRLMRIIPIA